MKVALAEATGFIGSHVLTELQQHGHEVTAFVRNNAQAETVAALGALPAVVDLYDRPAPVGLLRSTDGAIHTASPGDATTATLESAVVDVVISEHHLYEHERRAGRRRPLPSPRRAHNSRCHTRGYLFMILD